MKKFLITTDKFSGFHNLYNLDGNQISLHKIKDSWDLCYPSKMNFYIRFPLELVHKIIDHLLLIYLQNGSFEFAANLVLFSKDTIRRFYLKYLGNDTFCGTMNLSYRISYTLRTCFNIFELVVGHVRNHHEYNTINLFRGDFVNRVTPWNIDDELYMTVPSERLFYENYPGYKVFRTGPSLHDQCWIQGQDIFGLVKATFFRSPVLVIAVTTYDGEISWKDNIDLKKFEKMASLLKLTFGPNTGVFIVIADALIRELVEVVEI